MCVLTGFLGVSTTKVLSEVIQKSQFILNSTIAAKQISGTVSILGSMMTRQSLNSEVFLSYLPSLLLQLLPAIDLNDLVKTTHALSFYKLFLNQVPIFSLADGPEALVAPDGMSEEVVEARLAVVQVLPEWAFAFLDKILDFVSYTSNQIILHKKQFSLTLLSYVIWSQKTQEA